MNKPEDKNQAFRKMADSFIDVANQHCDGVESTQVGSAMMFATTRFSAFVVASHSKNKAGYESEIDNAVNFFTDEFRRMLTENMEEYKAVFKEEPKPKYEHLIKK